MAWYKEAPDWSLVEVSEAVVKADMIAWFGDNASVVMRSMRNGLVNGVKANGSVYYWQWDVDIKGFPPL